jgi:hypothetical protein
VAAILAGLSVAASASPAAASVTIGQLAPGSAAPCNGAPGTDYLQPTVTSGNSYVMPATGTIVSWSTKADAGSAPLTMKVFRKVADPARYQVVGHDESGTLATGVNGRTANLAVRAGDVLGIHRPAATSSCVFSAPGETYLYREVDLADGASVDFLSSTDFRPNLTAVLVPDNNFTLGKIKRNTKKGTATLTVEAPNPGELTGSGEGVTAAGAAGAVISKTVGAPGEVKLLIKAKGKKRRKLNETGKVKLNISISYTPTGGDPNTQSRKLKLKKH